MAAAVAVTTGAFVDNLFSLGRGGLFGPGSTIAVLYGACLAILLSGRFALLDALIKLITFALVVSTLAALTAAVATHDARTPQDDPAATAAAMEGVQPWSASGIRFLIDLMGSMPVSMDTGSIGNSLWTLERHRTSGLRPTLKETSLEFLGVHRRGSLLRATATACT